MQISDCVNFNVSEAYIQEELDTVADFSCTAIFPVVTHLKAKKVFFSNM